MPKSISESSLFILNKMDAFIDELKKESFDFYKRKELRDFLLANMNSLQPIEINQMDYSYEEVRSKYLKVHAKLVEMQDHPLFRLNQSDADNQYDSVIIDLFLKIFSQEEGVKTSRNPPVILSVNRLTAADLAKLGVVEKSATTIASGALSSVITPSSPHSTASNPSTVPASSPRRTVVTFDKDVEDHHHINPSKIKTIRKKLQPIIDLSPPLDMGIVYWKFFTKRDISRYPPAAIEVALDFVKSCYPNNGPHYQKIFTLKSEVENMKDIQKMLNKITEAREGTGFGRLNAALKRIEDAIKNNKKIDLNEIKKAMDDHDATNRNLLKRLFF